MVVESKLQSDMSLDDSDKPQGGGEAKPHVPLSLSESSLDAFVPLGNWPTHAGQKLSNQLHLRTTVEVTKVPHEDYSAHCGLGIV